MRENKSKEFTEANKSQLASTWDTYRKHLFEQHPTFNVSKAEMSLSVNETTCMI